MSYLAIARKWRPSRFEDLVGQSHVVQTLKNAIVNNRVAHAYLFSGTRGTGKTSVARIFAKALRCPNVKEGAPCNECPECLAISDSRSVDVVEIDGASNNGVEAVRSIRENVAYGASVGDYKIYIIDEVHMLSISAFNALLKTLEEPPPSVVFLLATTESQKLPLTILSRCQRFEFRRLTIQEIKGRLEQILVTENVLVSEPGLKVIASHSEGSLRDALSLLDQVLSFHSSTGGEPLSERQVVDALGISGTTAAQAFLSKIVNRDRAGILSAIREIHASGVDLKHFAQRTLEELRLLYLSALARQDKELISSDELDISPSQFTELSEMASKVSVIQIERMVQILSKAISQLGFSSLPRFVLEIAAFRMSSLDGLEKVENLLSVKAAEPETKRSTETAPADKQLREPLSVEQNKVRPVQQEGHRVWQSFVEAVLKKRPLIGALLSHAHFRFEDEPAGKSIILAFPEGSFYEKQAADSKNRHDIEEHVKMFFGRETTVLLSTQLDNTLPSLQELREEQVQAVKASVLGHPAVTKMQEILNADVVDVTVGGDP
ncbi:MAG: DNA polymerase III subunit gamma/tau [Deltaproteobacteria bacterium]|nr:DNA polymerase III subunit gamma/tau [Deltaproteobacteria bacterium]